VSKPSLLTAGVGVLAALALMLSGGAPAAGASATAAAAPFLSSLHTASSIGSTVPANGDVNPYGLVVVHTPPVR
jgi:hypothetical protein